MNGIIDNLTNNPNQTSTVVLSDGTTVEFNFRFMDTASPAFWVFDVVYDTLGFEVNNINLSTHPNILRQWKNILPFGLLVNSSDGLDPLDINDFINGRITLVLLDKTGIAAVEAYLTAVETV
jgi:hypothetical protein